MKGTQHLGGSALAAAAALLALGLVTGCAARGSSANPFAQDERHIQISVRNLNWSDATLHAVSIGGRERLGVVGGKGEGRFTMDWDHSQDLQIEIDLLAGPRCLTRRVSVDPGDELELEIVTDIRRDSNCVPSGLGR